jgi:hypothetical protein
VHHPGNTIWSPTRRFRRRCSSHQAQELISPRTSRITCARTRPTSQPVTNLRGGLALSTNYDNGPRILGSGVLKLQPHAEVELLERAQVVDDGTGRAELTIEAAWNQPSLNG